MIEPEEKNVIEFRVIHASPTGVDRVYYNSKLDKIHKFYNCNKTIIKLTSSCYVEFQLNFIDFIPHKHLFQLGRFDLFSLKSFKIIACQFFLSISYNPRCKIGVTSTLFYYYFSFLNKGSCFKHVR